MIMDMYYMRKQDSNAMLGLHDFIKNLPSYKNLVMIEIGCYMGESTSMFASSDKIHHIYAVDPWQNELDELKASDKTDMKIVESLFDKNTKIVAHKITKIKKTSSAAALDFQNIAIDLVYIDGSHKKQMVQTDLENYVPLISKNGFVSGHDWQSPYVREAVLEYMKRTPDMVFRDNSWIYKL